MIIFETVNAHYYLNSKLVLRKYKPHAPTTINRSGGRQYKFIASKKTVNEKQSYSFTSRLGSKTITRTSTLPLIRFNYTTCPECSSTVYEFDPHKMESFCPRCGLVLEESADRDQKLAVERRQANYGGLTGEEKVVLARRGRYDLRYTTKEDWISYNDTRMIKTITSQVGLTYSQTELVIDIIDGVTYKSLNSRLSKEHVVLAVSRYVLKASGVHPSMLRYNGLFSQLKRKDYNVVESNIKEFFQ